MRVFVRNFASLQGRYVFVRARIVPYLFACFAVAATLFTIRAPRAEAQAVHRSTLVLDGTWNVEDSVGPEDMPRAYTHRVPVPGLTHSASPAFPDVDQFKSRQLLASQLQQGRISQEEFDRLGNARGLSHQKRNYFWYERTFDAPAQKDVGILQVNKAQFGTVVYLNGQKIGEHDPCFTAAHFDITRAIRWGTRNEVVIRLGAHPGVLPPNVSGGTDFEKNLWTPGIYDDVKLLAMDNPVISNVQVAPRIADSSILVQTELHNYAGHAVTTFLDQQVHAWKSLAEASGKVQQRVELAAGETKKILQTIPVPNAHLWSPEDPFLYEVETRTSGDSVVTRFGMREFRFDTVTQRAYLNGRPYFLRGSNIALHRFFEDPQGGTLPWDETWVRRLLMEIPKQMHWNAFRFSIGPVPDRWLEIADESGLLVQNEYMVWVGAPSWGIKYQNVYDTQEMITEFREWMRDNWNHPSLAIWDASNESWLPEFSSTIIPAVRGLDLSHRPWENSYATPAGPDDPVEDHPYLLFRTAMGDPAPLPPITKSDSGMPDFESLFSSGPSTGHAMILNEYGWLWLNRDGTPTLLTQKLYSQLLGDKSTPEDRFALQAYLLGGETEYWRASRRYAGVLHFVYLTVSDPKGFTSDNFQNIRTLTLQPLFAKAMEQAFNPLGVYLNFWHPALKTGESHNFTIAMVNDQNWPRSGKLRLSFTDADRREAAAEEIPFSLQPLGAQSYNVTIKVPGTPGNYSLQAVASPADDGSHPTTSRRDVILQTSAPSMPQP